MYKFGKLSINKSANLSKEQFHKKLRAAGYGGSVLKAWESYQAARKAEAKEAAAAAKAEAKEKPKQTAKPKEEPSK